MRTYIGRWVNSIEEAIAASPVLYFECKVSRAQLPDTPLRSDTQALRFIARIPSYPAEEKVAFSRRKKRLPVVIFLCLRTWS